jgi:hypothetical protein
VAVRKLQTTNTDSRFFTASSFIVGRGWSGVKALQCNGLTLAFCNPEDYSCHSVESIPLRPS